MQPDLALKHYQELLVQWQKTINLISPMTLNDSWTRHFEDSIQLINFIPSHVKTLYDIGSGAGFPALVIAIMRPDIRIHLVESDTRKCAFLRTVSRETFCENVTVHNGRIEDILTDEIECDLVTARALASLKQLFIYTKPLWDNHIQFKMLLPKGQNYQDEIADAESKYTFDYSEYPSKTDEDARILLVGNIIEK
jgi:16S rRNA (guanine527-N7)-methyltransferase